MHGWHCPKSGDGYDVKAEMEKYKAQNMYLRHGSISPAEIRQTIKPAFNHVMQVVALGAPSLARQVQSLVGFLGPIVRRRPRWAGFGWFVIAGQHQLQMYVLLAPYASDA